MKGDSRKQSENLIECFKIYYNIINLFDYLKNIDIRVEDFDL
jgi:hypothetical protein